jgi:glycosyltransferase involved in cell wall biosynthesis
MKIGIDARFLTHPQTGGFKSYSTHLINALTQIDTANEYVLYVDRAAPRGAAWASSPNNTVRVVPGDVPLMGMPWREQVHLARMAARDRLDLFHAPCLTAPLRLACPLVVTIHDMIWHTPPAAQALGLKRMLMARYYQTVPRLAAQRAAAVITISQAAKQRIVAELGLKPEQVTVTYAAAGPDFGHIKDEQRLSQVRQRFALENGYILAIGSADPRKNMATLIAAYSRLPQALQARHPLVIVWTHSLLSEQMAHLVDSLGLGNCIRFVQSVSNEELCSLYNMAALFVFPSREEGFGLPLLEAMACGTPVIAADNSSIPEVAGDAAVFVDAEDAPAMTSVITAILTDTARRRGLIERGYQRAAGFSWARCAEETLSIYQAVGLAKRSPLPGRALSTGA